MGFPPVHFFHPCENYLNYTYPIPWYQYGLNIAMVQPSVLLAQAIHFAYTIVNGHYECAGKG
jgi:hypothetical protein